MNPLSPFFLLIQRPMVLFGAVGWMIIATLFVGGLVTSGGDERTYMDASYLALVILAVYTGWIAGACVLELQQTSFAGTLPGAPARLASGFLLLGLIAVAIAAALVTGASPVDENPWLLLAVGFGCYGLGGIIRDPQSNFMTGVTVALFLVMVAASGTLGRLADSAPVLVGCMAMALLVIGVYRLFAREAFRNRPVNPRSVVLAFSLEKLSSVERRRVLASGPRGSRWKHNYLGQDVRNWVRAAWHETWGEFKLRSFTALLTRSWGLFLLLTLAAMETRDRIGFWKSLAWSLHDAIMRSPHSPVYGDKGGPFIIIGVGVLVLGATMAVFRPVSLLSFVAHPVSRDVRARVAFAGSMLDLSLLLLVAAPVLFVVGHATGWVVGIESRFDYMPYFFRVLLMAAILMPFAYELRLRIAQSAGSRDGQSLAAVIMLQIAFILSGMFMSWVSGRVFDSAGFELGVLLTLLLLSRRIYEARLWSWYRTADL